MPQIKALDDNGNPVEMQLDDDGNYVPYEPSAKAAPSNIGMIPSHEPSKGRFVKKGLTTQWEADSPVDITQRPDTSMFNATKLGEGRNVVSRFALEALADPTVFGGGSLVKKGISKGISKFTGKKNIVEDTTSLPTRKFNRPPGDKRRLNLDGKTLTNLTTGEIEEIPGMMPSHSVDPNLNQGVGDAALAGSVPYKQATDNTVLTPQVVGPHQDLSQEDINLAKHMLAEMRQTYGTDSEEYLEAAEELKGLLPNFDAPTNITPSKFSPQQMTPPRFNTRKLNPRVRTEKELLTIEDDIAKGPKNLLNEFISSEEGSMAIPDMADIKTAVMKTANTMKTMSSSLDLSAPLRQGIGLMHRGEYYTAAKNMGRYMADENFFTNSMNTLRARPLNKLGEDSGLFISDHLAPTRMEEHFADSYINTLRESGSRFGRIITEPFAASERAYVGFLNELRANTFDSLVTKAQKSGIPMYTAKLDSAGKPVINVTTKNVEMVPNELAKKIAKYVNTASGRGDLGKLAKVGEELNVLFFSPRFVASRMQTLDPRFLIKADPFLRKEAIKTWVGITSMIGAMNGVAAVTGNEYNLTDPTSSDFGKGKFGNTRFDTGAGHLQYIVAMSRFLNRSYESLVKGNPPAYGQPSALGGMFGLGQQQPSFMENKFSPMAGLVDSILTGRRNFDGTPISVPTEIVKRFTPMFMQDMTELMQSEPDLFEPGSMLKIGAAGTLGILGTSVQTYGSNNGRGRNSRTPRMRRSSR